MKDRVSQHTVWLFLAHKKWEENRRLLPVATASFAKMQIKRYLIPLFFFAAAGLNIIASQSINGRFTYHHSRALVTSNMRKRIIGYLTYTQVCLTRLLWLLNESFYIPSDIRIHFVDTVNSLEKLSKDAKSMFERAEETLVQVNNADDDEQGYCKQNLLDVIWYIRNELVIHKSQIFFFQFLTSLLSQLQKQLHNATMHLSTRKCVS